MSTPHSAPGPIRRLAAGVSRWRNTRRGTSTLKAAYAQAARDVKRMDPEVRRAIGRSGLTPNDLKHLAQANTAALVSPRGAQAAAQLNAWASGRVQATTPAAQRTLNPIKAVSKAFSSRQDRRRGTAILKAAYAQARQDVKRMDPAVREAIGRSKFSKHDLAAMSQAQVTAPLAAGIQQAAQQHQLRARAEALARSAGPRHAAAPESAGQRVANAVNTASRWAKAAKSYPVEKAKKFQADYAERRQNPTGRSARPQVAPSGQQAQPAWAVQPVQPQAARTGQPGPAAQGQTAQGNAAQSPAAQGHAAPSPAAQGPVAQSPEETARLAQAHHAALNNTVSLSELSAAGAEGQQTAATGSDKAYTGRHQAKADTGRHHATDAATKAFEGVASPAGATKQGTAQNADGRRPEGAGHGRHQKTDGKEK